MGDRLALGAVLLALWMGQAEGRPLGRSREALGRSLPDIAAVVRKAKPAVVSITTTPRPGSGEDANQRGLGAGFVIDPDGYILTAAHVVEGSGKIQVAVSDVDGQPHDVPARLVGIDSLTDVALLKVDVGRRLPTLPMAHENDVDVADWVIAIGNPFGLAQTVTVGIVSFKGRSEVTPAGRSGYFDYLQTDASINPGSSGGPVLDLRGRVVAIANAVNVSGQGIGFAVPIDLARSVLPDLRAHGRVQRGWLGVTVDDESGGPALGALVTEVFPEGPAARAGLAVGDRILAIDRKQIDRARSLRAALALRRQGALVTLVVRRGPERRLTKIRLTREPPEPTVEAVHSEAQARPAGACLGATVTAVDAAAARTAGLASSFGALVMAVDPQSSLGLAGLAPGDVVLKVNSAEVNDPKQFLQTVEQALSGELLRVFVRRGPRTLPLSLRKP